jgi:hypothetical protein
MKTLYIPTVSLFVARNILVNDLKKLYFTWNVIYRADK